MFTHLRPAVFLLTLSTVVTGVLYPAVVTCIAQLFFRYQANGSLIHFQEKAVGSELIGQMFIGEQYFWGRLSATAPFPYNPSASAGSNFGPMHPALADAAQSRLESLHFGNGRGQPVPMDLITSSASGLDPHISPAAAEFQIERVAKRRRMNAEQVRALVSKHTLPRQLGIFGEPRVNVLLLNLELDRSASEASDTLP